MTIPYHKIYAELAHFLLHMNGTFCLKFVILFLFLLENFIRIQWNISYLVIRAQRSKKNCWKCQNAQHSSHAAPLRNIGRRMWHRDRQIERNTMERSKQWAYICIRTPTCGTAGSYTNVHRHVCVYAHHNFAALLYAYVCLWVEQSYNKYVTDWSLWLSNSSITSFILRTKSMGNFWVALLQVCDVAWPLWCYVTLRCFVILWSRNKFFFAFSYLHAFYYFPNIILFII